MILVDTNVWSELLRPVPDQEVVAWFLEIGSGARMSAITIQEITRGVERLPDGSRKEALRRAARKVIDQAGEPLAYDGAAARECGALLARLERSGTPIGGAADAQVAATAISLGLPVATRNTRHFTTCGLPVIDPWQTAGPERKSG